MSRVQVPAADPKLVRFQDLNVFKSYLRKGYTPFLVEIRFREGSSDKSWFLLGENKNGIQVSSWYGRTGSVMKLGAEFRELKEPLSVLDSKIRKGYYLVGCVCLVNRLDYLSTMCPGFDVRSVSEGESWEQTLYGPEGEVLLTVPKEVAEDFRSVLGGYHELIRVVGDRLRSNTRL